MKKVIFLDRDGTIIVDKVYLNDPDGIEYLPGVEEALKLLNSKGYEFVIVTNQSGVPRGIVSLENLDAIHRRIKSHFETHGIHFLSFHFAPYMTDSNHEMRKPNAGMLKEASEMHGISFSESWMIGDRMTDVEAGHRAGCRSVFLTGSEEHDSSHYEAAEIVADSLLEAARKILELEK